MLKKIRVVLAWVFWIGITLLLLDFTGTLHAYLGWMAKVQFLPAVLAVNVGVIVGLVLLTLVFGRVYCSVICPLGVFQDAVSRLGTWKKKAPYKYHKELKWLRYGVWAVFVVLLIVGVQAAVALLAPYSAYGRMVQNLLQPIYLWGNNLLALWAERAGSYAFYSKEVWLRSLPTFIIAVVTLVMVVALSFKGGRTYCNSICPVGTTLSFFSRFAMFRPVIDPSKCKHCKACELHCKAQCIAIGKDSEHIDYSRLGLVLKTGPKRGRGPPGDDSRHGGRCGRCGPQGRGGPGAGGRQEGGRRLCQPPSQTGAGAGDTRDAARFRQRKRLLSALHGLPAVRSRMPQQRAASLRGPGAPDAAGNELRERLVPAGVHPLQRALPGRGYPED